MKKFNVNCKIEVEFDENGKVIDRDPITENFEIEAEHIGIADTMAHEIITNKYGWRVSFFTVINVAEIA